MVPDLQKLGTLHYGNVYEDSTLDGMARRVLDSSPERFVLVGFSMGGFVSRVLCLMAPERVSGVAFVASSARGYSEEETERRKKGFGPGGRPPRAASGAQAPVDRVEVQVRAAAAAPGLDPPARQRHDVVDRRRQAALDDGAGAESRTRRAMPSSVESS